MKNMKRIALVGVTALLLNACATNTETGGLAGAGVGAALGSVISSATGGSKTQGAVIGGVVGSVAGALIGQRMDTQAKELQQVQGVENVKYDQQQQTINAELKVLFDIDQWNLKYSETAKLDNLSSVFMKYPENIVMIEGHTDSTGSESHNLQLSQRRAASVESYLRGKNLGIASLSSAGYGSARPVASNATASGREQNRRVEIKISVDPNRVPQPK